MLPLPIHRFAPLSTQWSPSRRAVVSRPTESDPWPGSVSANAPTFSSRAIAGSQRCFCSSEPSMLIEPMARPFWTPRKVLTLPSPRDSSSVTMPAASRDSPGQPYPVIAPPPTPSAAIFGTSSNGNSARSQ